MVPIPLFIEICAGLASVSGVLQHGAQWKPPISRMGRKTGYAEAILRVMGIRPRQGAARYLWAEADSDVAALLAAYTQPEVMRQIADTIRSWIPCPYGPHEGWCSRCKGTGRWDARDLWEVLRREKRRGLWEGFDRDAAARCVTLGSWSYRQGDEDSGGFVGPGDRRQDTSALALALALALGRAALPWPPVLIAQDARIEPGEVAGWSWLAPRSYKACADHGFKVVATNTGDNAYQPDTPAPLFDRCCIWPPVHLTPDATIQPSQIPPGTVVFCDPPYQGTTGYKNDLPRAEVIAIAERWASAGARVYISEAEPIAIPGWFHVDIGGERKGQARTFGHTQEWLTCSHPPAWTPAVQARLF